MYKVKIERLDHQGRGICKVQGKTTFVFNALPGEIVNIDIIENKKNYNIGKVIDYVSLSKNRVNPICPYYGICGGCDLMHFDYSKQLLFKKEKIIDIFNRYSNVNINVNDIVSDSDLYYRNKVTLKVKKNIGYFEKLSHNIVNISFCYLVNERINEIIKIVSKYELKNISEVVIKSMNNQVLILFKGKNIPLKLISELKDIVSGILLYDNEYKLIYGQDYIIGKINKYNFHISIESFFQVNTFIVEKMYDEVKSYIDKDSVVLDLYSGTGTIGIYVSEFSKKVISVEINKMAVNDALINKDINNISNIDFICDDVSNVIDKFKEQIDIVIVDPPRSGLDKKTIQYLKIIDSKKIIYVSCNPFTLVRDINLLVDKYEVLNIKPFDMFPNTGHVECVSVLHRKTLKK